MKHTMEYTENTFEAMVEAVLAEMEAKGEKLPDSKVEE